MEQQMFDVYSYNELNNGKLLKVERTIYPNKQVLGQELSEFLQNNTKEELEKLQKEYKEEELSVFEKTKSQVEKWVKAAEQVTKVNLALEYLNAPEVSHTNNRWQITTDGSSTNYEISNKTYRMWFRIYENIEYKDGIEVSGSWEVTWNFSTNSSEINQNYSRIITGQNYKKFKEKEKCMKYIDGRKKAYAKYFKEVQPVIIAGYEGAFTVNGMLLKGYTVETN